MKKSDYISESLTELCSVELDRKGDDNHYTYFCILKSHPIT